MEPISKPTIENIEVDDRLGCVKKILRCGKMGIYDVMEMVCETVKAVSTRMNDIVSWMIGASEKLEENEKERIKNEQARIEQYRITMEIINDQFSESQHERANEYNREKDERNEWYEQEKQERKNAFDAEESKRNEAMETILNESGELMKVKDMIAQMGYFECNSYADERDKIVNTAADFFIYGLSMKVKMKYATATGITRMRVNGVVHKMYYNGEPANADNTWEDGEILEMFSDGNVFYAKKWHTNTAENNTSIAALKTKQEEIAQKQEALNEKVAELDRKLVALK